MKFLKNILKKSYVQRSDNSLNNTPKEAHFFEIRS